MLAQPPSLLILILLVLSTRENEEQGVKIGKEPLKSKLPGGEKFV
jgi:hypothetical protein